MAEAATPSREPLLTDEIAKRRLLCDVMHLQAALRPDGSIDPAALADIRPDYFTGVQEMIPTAVTITRQQVETARDPEGRKQRIIKWLGRSAIEVAESGYQFCVSEAGLRRVPIEVAEARHNQDNLQAGIAQVMVSPKMSRQDASEEVAEAENLHAADGIRVAYAITDTSGEIVERRIESLLVSDVGLESWVAMLQDSDNLFGQAFQLRDVHSALSVMELFSLLDLPEERLPEGPVTLVAAVLPYITDPAARTSVRRQLEHFRKDQADYRRKSERLAGDWLAFDSELARSLSRGTATPDVESFIASLQHAWSAEDLSVINRHDSMGKYSMTTELAAVLEKAQRYLISSQASLATDNQDVLRQTDASTARDLRDRMERIEQMRVFQADPADIAFQQAQLHRLITRQNFKTPGGCAGGQAGNFENGSSSDSQLGTVGGDAAATSAESATGWTWKKGVCRVNRCTSPQPTEVGPCSVCRNCQHKFDKGQDPTAGPDIPAIPAKKPPKQPGFSLQDIIGPQLKQRLNPEPVKVATKLRPARPAARPRETGKYALAA